MFSVGSSFLRSSFATSDCSMAPAMNAMKAMKAGGAMTATGAFSAVAEKSGLKSKDVKAVVTNYMELVASEKTDPSRLVAA